jgi:peptidyl-prolyl isomerase D
MDMFQETVHICTITIEYAGLTYRKVDAKLYYRRGCSYSQLHNYEDAVSDLQQALTLNPKDTTIAKKLKEIKQLLEAKKQKEKRAYSKMFGGI